MNVKIEKLIYGGEGLAHHNGATVFVPFVLPDEEVRLAEVERKKKFVRARVEGWVRASPERIPAACPHFTACGGCHYQHIPYEAQLRFKTEILRENLRRIGRIEWNGAIAAHPSPPWGYRNRAQWKVPPLGSSGGVKNPALGYLRAGSSALCAVEECPILSPRLFDVLCGLRNVLACGELPPGLREVEAFADASDTTVLLNASFKSFPSGLDVLGRKFRGAIEGLESLLIRDLPGKRMQLLGPGFLRYEAAGHSFRVGHMSFFQVNRYLIDEMARTVVDAAGEGGLALDIFAGVGLFTLLLGRNFERVVGVEANPAGARDLEANIGSSGVRAEFRNVEANEFLETWMQAPDAVILDPPRPGISSAMIVRLGELGPRRIVYVSCEPSTLARDLAGLSRAGYEPREIHIFDLFPQTYHIESVVTLERRK